MMSIQSISTRMKNPFKIRILSIWLTLAINLNPLYGAMFTEEFIASPTFVDKTLLLKDFLGNETRIFLTAPSGFGKTTNLEMIKKFCQVECLAESPRIPVQAETLTKSDKIFTKLKIAQYDHIMTGHFGQHPVIYLDFKTDTEEDEKWTSEENLRRMFKNIIVNAVNHYKDLILDSNHTTGESKFALELDSLRRIVKDENMTSDLPTVDQLLVQSIRFLSKFLNGYYNRTVVLLIDNYDYTLRKFFIDSRGRLNLFDKFIEGLLRESLKSADSEIGHVIIASVTSLRFNFEPSEKMQKFLFFDNHTYTPYFGLTQEEIDNLLEKYNCNDTDKSIINQTCNGLETKVGQKIYNTSCTMSYLKSRTDADTWISSISPTNFIWKLLKDPEYLDLFGKLLKHCPTRHGSHDFISFADFSKLIENDFNEPFVSGDNCTPISFLIQEALLGPIRGRSYFAVPNHLAHRQIAADMRYYYEKEANIDFKLIGSHLYDIFISIKANTTIKPDLDRYLTEVFRQFKPMNFTRPIYNKSRANKVKNPQPLLNGTNSEVNLEPSKNLTAAMNPMHEEETSLKFVHQSIIHLGALTHPNLKVIEDYPLPISYEKSRSNAERRCATCIVHENIALIVKSTDTVTLQVAEQRAHKFYNYSQPGVDQVRYLVVHVDDQKQVTTSVSMKKIVVQGNGTSRGKRRKKELKALKANRTKFSTIIVGNTTVIVGNTTVMVSNSTVKDSNTAVMVGNGTEMVGNPTEMVTTEMFVNTTVSVINASK